MFNKNLKLTNRKISTETYLFFASSILFFLFSKIFDIGITDTNILSIILFSFVVFFGLPHGALDTLIAKKFKIYNIRIHERSNKKCSDRDFKRQCNCDANGNRLWAGGRCIK